MCGSREYRCHPLGYGGATICFFFYFISIPIKVRTARVKVSESWKRRVPWVKINGTWYSGIEEYNSEFIKARFNVLP